MSTPDNPHPSSKRGQEKKLKLLIKAKKAEGRYLATKDCADRLRQKAGDAYSRGNDVEAKSLRDAANYLDSVADQKKTRFEELKERWVSKYERKP